MQNSESLHQYGTEMARARTLILTLGLLTDDLQEQARKATLARTTLGDAETMDLLDRMDVVSKSLVVAVQTALLHATDSDKEQLKLWIKGLRWSVN